MPYAQINYQQTLGTGSKAVSIAAAGCFLTAFSNLAERFGAPIDPPTLDNFFITHNDFIREADGTDDLLSWGSVTAYNPNWRVSASGNGAPTDNNSIVKFIYNGGTTHFCLVLDAAQHLIIDSWDGKVKNWSVYGGPVAYATYTNSTPAATTTAKPVAPASNGTFTVVKAIAGYRTSNDAANHTNQADTVEPKTYEIFNQAHGMVNVSSNPAVAGSWINPADNVADAPVAPAAPTPPANTVYTKLAAPLDLVTNKQPTNWWELGFVNDAHATAAAQLAQGTPFRAFGKAQRTDGDRPCYYMTEEDFGQADVIGFPANNNGVNTVDLRPAPAPEAPTVPAAPETPTPAAEAADGAVNVTVTVKSWQDTFDTSVAGTYIATKDVTITDLAGKLADVQLGHDQTVHVAGKVTKDGQDYYITEKSHEAGNWYGIPAGVLVRKTTPVRQSQLLEDIKHPVAAAHQALDEVDKISAELNKDPEFAKFKSQLTPRGKVVADIAEVEEKVDGFLTKVNIFKKKNK